MAGLINKHAALVVETGEQVPGNWIAAAGLDWEPEIRPLSYPGGDGRLIETELSRVVVRSDTGAALAVVGGSYHATPHRRIMLRAADVLAEQGFTLRCAGSIQGGTIPFAEFAAPALGGDPIRPSVLVMPRHDLERPAMVSLETRLFCTNVIEAMVLGFGAAAGSEHQRVTHRWTSETQEATLVHAAELANHGARHTTRRAVEMARVNLSTQAQVDFLTRAFGLEEADDETRKRARLYGSAVDAIDQYNGQLGRNLWAALNCVSHAIDHRPRQTGGMLLSAVTGKLALLRDKANRIADEMVDLSQNGAHFN